MKKGVIKNWDELPIVLNTSMLALIFDKTEETINRWAKADRIPAFKINREFFFNKEEIKTLIEGGKKSEE